jgi:hypothetical protein
MTVEDAIEVLSHYQNRGLFTIANKDDWASNFITNVSAYTAQEKPLSTEQSRIILKLVQRERAYLIERGLRSEEIDALLANPTYRLPPYPSANVPREVRFLGDNLLGFRFKRNDAINGALNRLMVDRPYRFDNLWFHREYRVWVVPITRHNLAKAMDVICEHRFAFDDEVAEFLAACESNKGRPAAFTASTELNVIAGQVYDCEVLAWWTRNVLGGTLA